jgi:hypothetical protein
MVKSAPVTELQPRVKDVCLSTVFLFQAVFHVRFRRILPVLISSLVWNLFLAKY